jgi:hypothetical protein
MSVVSYQIGLDSTNMQPAGRKACLGIQKAPAFLSAGLLLQTCQRASAQHSMVHPCKCLNIHGIMGRNVRAQWVRTVFFFVGIFLFHNIHVCYQKIGSCESGFIKMSFCRKGAALPHKGQQLTSVFDHIEWGREANLSLDVCFFLEN